MGYHLTVGTTKLVRHFIPTRSGGEYGRERRRQLLHTLGFRLRRLRHGHLQAKAEEQDAFGAELEAVVEAWPEAWEWRCVDDATVRRHPPRPAQWRVVDEVPEVPTGADQAKVHGDGAVAPLTGRPHYQVRPELGKGECAPLVQPLLAYHPGKRLLVRHDRGEQHPGAPVEALVREANGRLVLQAQPAYSPELNPQERLWKWLRRVVTHNHWGATLTAQSDAIRHCFRSLAGVSEQVRQLCGFQTPGSVVASL